VVVEIFKYRLFWCGFGCDKLTVEWNYVFILVGFDSY